MEYYSWKNLNVQVKERKSRTGATEKEGELSATRTVLRNCSLHHWVDFQPRVAGSCSPLWSLPKHRVSAEKVDHVFFSAGRKGVSNRIIFNTEWSEKGVESSDHVGHVDKLWRFMQVIHCGPSCDPHIHFHYCQPVWLKALVDNAQDAQKGFTPRRNTKSVRGWVASEPACQWGNSSVFELRLFLQFCVYKK